MIPFNESTIAEHRARGRGRRLFWGLLLTAGALVVGIALSGCARHHRHPSADEVLSRLDRGASWLSWKVGATDEQREQIQAILGELRPDEMRFHAEREALTNRVLAAIEAGHASPDELAQIRQAGVDLSNEAMSRSFETILKASEVLTPEQRKELVALWRDHR